MIIRHAEERDLGAILAAYAYAREFMKRTGNPNQWCDSKPEEATVREDIRLGRNYVFEADGEVAGVFALMEGEDPTYGRIDGGRWLAEGPYVTIHRIAGNGKVHGLLKEAVRFAEDRAPSVRIDTHEDNRVMQHLLKECGFTRCGIIYLENGDPRIAYQKLSCPERII